MHLLVHRGATAMTQLSTAPHTQMLSGEFMSDNAKFVLECFEIGIDEMLDRSAMPVCTLCVYGKHSFEVMLADT